ncbi:MAG: ketoacyl-ACP synthase III [Chloroflexi bacterium]|nr:ketoacyl-ACP synthase III [Chloroflexota bacterium]
MRYAHIIGWGGYLPDKILTNHDIAQLVDTSDEWIYTRTGIRERRIAAEKETTATLAFEAAARALAVAGVQPSQVDLIIVATSTPEYVFPATAVQVQDLLGAKSAGAFDLAAACSGFVYGLDMASQAITTGSIDTAVVIGAETLSRIVDWTDRGTCILFGDGAGAVVLKGSSVPGGLLASLMRADGSGAEALKLPASYQSPLSKLGVNFPPEEGIYKRIEMNGRQVFRFATRVVAESIEQVVEDAGLTLDDIDLIVPHQANMRIIEATAKRLKIPLEKFFMNVNRVGNTSTASIPLALCDASSAGRLHPDDNVIFVGFGGGLTWAAAALKWDVTPPDISFIERDWQRARYVWARLRSRLRQVSRGIGARILGSPTPDAKMKDAEKK